MSDQAAIHPPQAAVPLGPQPQADPRNGPAGSQLIWNLISTALLAALLAWRMGWVWALAGVAGVFVHEYGHVLAMNALGCGPARIRIVPFLGGAAIASNLPATQFDGVLIAVAGPVFGLIAMAPFWGAYAVTGNGLWLDGAFFIAVINLLNLAPAPPLDGSKALGPVLARIHPWLERGVLLAIGVLALDWALRSHNLIVGVFIALGTAQAAFSPVRRAPDGPLSGRQWAFALALYLGAAALCFAALSLSTNGDGLHVLQRMLGG